MTWTEPTGERLAANVAHFARLLRRAGLRVGPGDTSTPSARSPRSTSCRATSSTGRSTRCWCAATPTTRCSTRRSGCSGAIRWGCRARWRCSCRRSGRRSTARVSRRLSEAWRPPAPAAEPPKAREQPPEIDTFLAYSADEILRTRDFDQMSADELARARALVRRLELDVRPLVTRRTRPAVRGEVDRARTLRAALRGGGELIALRHRARVERPPVIVALCDISGSMGRYSEMLLRFLHALLDRARPRPRVPVRDPAHQRHPHAAPPRRRRRARALRQGGRRLGVGHPARRLPPRVQPHVVAPRAGPGRRRAAGHRRPRSRGHRRARRRGRAAAAVVPPADSGSTRCCATPASSRAPPASARCCPTSTSTARSTTSTASRRSPGRSPATPAAAARYPDAASRTATRLVFRYRQPPACLVPPRGPAYASGTCRSRASSVRSTPR